MIYYKIQFKANKNIYLQDLELIEDYLGCLFKNGQVVDYDNIFTQDDSAFCCVTLSEDESISDTYSNEYVIKLKEIVKQFFDISLKEMGENWHLDTKICECKAPSYYAIICNPTHRESPITCGDCGCPVPLYKFPKIFTEKDYYTIREFERESKAIDDLWISCYNDNFIFKQRNNQSSPLVKKGRKISKALEEVTGIKFYYHIPLDSDDVSKCPFCGNDWEAKDNYMCDDCKIIADKE